MCHIFFFFFKQKTAYEMRISDWSSDVCSSDLSLLSRAFGPVFLDLLPTEGVGPLIRAPASETAASRPGDAPRLGRHPCLTRRRRPSMACFPHPPAGTPRRRFVVAASFVQKPKRRSPFR